MINKTNTDCETTLCYYETATRPRFFHGMLLTDEHLRAEQDYHREALKRVNRHLWGSGIVCGLTVEIKDLCLKINPGVALDCCGNLIEVCKCITLDLSKECEKKYGSDCPPRQPQGTGKDFEIKKYLVLRYMERETDLEPVLTPDTDCEPAGGKSKCSASKVQEGFCIELWDKCPCAHKDPGVDKGLIATLRDAGEQRGLAGAYQTAQNPAQTTADRNEGPVTLPIEPIRECVDLPLPCSDCGCCESAVGLAVLTINCEKKTVARDTECDCRRYVMSPRMLNWLFSTLRHDYKPSEITNLSSRVGHRSSKNFLAAAMTYEASSPSTSSPSTSGASTSGASTPGASTSGASTSGETVEDLDNKIKKLNTEITGLRKLKAEAKKGIASPPATPAEKPSATPPAKTPSGK